MTMMNYLEMLAEEYHSYIGYFVRSNVRARKRDRGGYDVEIDVLAFSPNNQKLLHIETSGAAVTWEANRESLMQKKFSLTKQEYEENLGCSIAEVQKVMIIGWAKSSEAFIDGEIKVVPIPAFIREIARELRNRHPQKEIVPEQFPLLRSMQMCLFYGFENQGISQQEG